MYDCTTECQHTTHAANVHYCKFWKMPSSSVFLKLDRMTARLHGWLHSLDAVDESVCMTVRKHDHACSECLLLQVFKNTLVVGRLGSGPRFVDRVESGVRVSDSFHIFSCAVIHAVALSGFRELWTFRSQDHSLPPAKVPGVELSLPGSFVPTNKEWKFQHIQKISKNRVVSTCYTIYDH